MEAFSFLFVLSLAESFLSLYFVVQYSKKGIRKLFSNPAFVLGDFLLIPVYFALVGVYFQNNFGLLLSAQPWLLFFVALLAALITLFFGLEFRLLKPVWIPHGIFHWLVVLSFLEIITISSQNGWAGIHLVGLASLILLIHQVLGAIFPKKIVSR